MPHERSVYEAASLFALTLLTAAALASGIAEPLTQLAGDALQRFAAGRAPPLAAGQPQVVVVAIDPQSLRARPEWPWPRTLHAEALRRLHEAGARAIAFDIDFSTPRPEQGDDDFVRAVREAGNVVLASFRQLQVLPGGAVLEIANEPFPALAGAAAAIGSVHVQVDRDGVLRQSPRSVEIGGVRVASLAETTLDVASGRSIGAAERGAFAIDYRRAEPAIPMLSFVDVIEGRFEASRVADKVVLIGATAAEFQDLWSTPLGPARPGVWIQAVALRTLAAARAGEPVLHTVAPSTNAAIVGALLLLAALVGRGADQRHARRWLAVASIGLGFGAFAAWAIARHGLLIDPVMPLAALMAQYVLGLEGVRRRFGARIAVREQSIAALARVGELTAAPASGDAGLGIALALLGDVVDASGVSLLRATPDHDLSGRRLDWQRRGEGEIGDLDVARDALVSRRVRIFEGARPGRGHAPGVAVYTPLHAGEVAIGVLVVERDRAEPLDATQLRTIATVGTQITLSAHNLALLADLRTTFDSSIEAIASAVEARDGYTEQHCRRLAVFSGVMAERLCLDADEIEAIRLGALLHDVGKVGIRDDILLKPGRFSEEERLQMERHASIGHGIISGIHGLRATTLACVRHHHERWDGTGYPDGLRAEETPLGARIVAIVDVWDALSTARPYKPAIEQARVREILRKDRGSHFDAALVDLFLELLDEEGDELLAWIEQSSRSTS